MSAVASVTTARSLATEGKFSHCRLSSAEAVQAERAAWQALVGEHHAGNPFLGPDWHLVWLTHFAGPDVTIHYVKVLQNGLPIAYFPMILRREVFRGMRVRVLRFAGNVYSPVNGPVIGHSDRRGVIDYFVRHVLPEFNCDLFIAADLPPELPGATELQNALSNAGYRVGSGIPTPNWIYEQPGITAPEYFRQLKYNLRSDTKRFPKKLAALGTMHYRLVGRNLTSADTTAYRQVYDRSWKEPEVDPSFHPDYMQAAAASGTLRLGLLYLDERPIAAQMWLFAQKRGYVVKTAYDEEFGAYSPGTLLTWWIIEQLISNEQMTFFDYLKGDDQYKRYWTNQRRERITLLAFPRSVKAGVLYLIDQWALPWLRQHSGLTRFKAQLARLRRRSQSDPGKMKGD